jgi:acyl-CoA synthetase (AMP-forming)/AMP-acid ligase II
MTLLYDWLKKAAKVQGNNKAVVYRDNYLSWRGLLHRVDRRAQEFKSMGIKEGAWVGLMLGNVPDFVILALALSKLEAAIVPIDPTTGGRELELILAAAPLRALVTRPRGSEGSISANGTSSPVPPSTLPRARVQRPTSPPPPGAPTPTPSADAAEVRRRLQGTLLTCSVYKRNPPEHGVDPIAVLLTSDSLGDPKGVLRTDKNTVAAVDQVIAALELSDKSKILVAVPLFHAYGWDLGFLPTLKLGATMFLEEEISARRIGKLVREHDVDVLPGTPTMYAEMSKLPTAKQLQLDKPRYLAAGSRLDQTVADDFANEYGVRVLSCYHSTEAATVTLEDTGKHPTTVGKPIEGVELRITTPDGKPVPAGKEGLIWVKSKTLSAKSIGPFDAEESPGGKARASGMVTIGAIDKAGWLRTGDLGKLDKNGRLMITGREDDVVKVDGKRVALGEVEGCLESFPKIKAAQATVVTDPMAGAMVVARVVTKQKCGAEEIIDHCARNLAPYKVPRRIEFCETI